MTWPKVAASSLVLLAVVAAAFVIPGGSQPEPRTGAPSPRHAGSAHLNEMTLPGGAGEAPTTREFLAWVPGGVPVGFSQAARRIGQFVVTPVAEDNVWMTRSWGSAGEVVDLPRPPFMVPMDVAAVDPSSFLTFVPPLDRRAFAKLRTGSGILGETAAKLRGLGPGGVLRFESGSRVRIVAVLPDEVVGGAELLVSRTTGRSIGVVGDRYILLEASGEPPSSRRLASDLTVLLPEAMEPSLRKVRVRARDEARFLRAGDLVLPPVIIKELFGEWTGRPSPGRPGYIDIDPAWVKANIDRAHVSPIGWVQCNRRVVPLLRDVMDDLMGRGASGTIRSYHGCFNARFINRTPGAMVSHHSWGIAIDLNLVGNGFGEPPQQDPHLVEAMRREGFVWGGQFLVPDGMHFEYGRRWAPSAE